MEPISIVIVPKIISVLPKIGVNENTIPILSSKYMPALTIVAEWR